MDWFAYQINHIVISRIFLRIIWDLFFEAEIYSCDVGVAKPRPQIFQKVQSLLGISSTEIIHVGDSLEGDVIGALCANWQAVYLNRSVAIDGVKVDGFKFYSIINSLLQLPLVLENLNN
ncbi:MAG: HAD family hydrolase [Sellimonas intestinalis]|uniref:HAD family hydrolase n=1 Tax=Sellimonas intestinalis TaxID=1653434 RepID=UPI003990DEA9